MDPFIRPAVSARWSRTFEVMYNRRREREGAGRSQKLVCGIPHSWIGGVAFKSIGVSLNHRNWKASLTSERTFICGRALSMPAANLWGENENCFFFFVSAIWRMKILGEEACEPYQPGLSQKHFNLQSYSTLWKKKQKKRTLTFPRCAAIHGLVQ